MARVAFDFTLVFTRASRAQMWLNSAPCIDYQFIVRILAFAISFFFYFTSNAKKFIARAQWRRTVHWMQCAGWRYTHFTLRSEHVATVDCVYVFVGCSRNFVEWRTDTSVKWQNLSEAKRHNFELFADSIEINVQWKKFRYEKTKWQNVLVWLAFETAFYVEILSRFSMHRKFICLASADNRIEMRKNCSLVFSLNYFLCSHSHRFGLCA